MATGRGPAAGGMSGALCLFLPAHARSTVQADQQELETSAMMTRVFCSALFLVASCVSALAQTPAPTTPNAGPSAPFPMPPADWLLVQTATSVSYDGKILALNDHVLRSSPAHDGQRRDAGPDRRMEQGSAQLRKRSTQCQPFHAGERQ